MRSDSVKERPEDFGFSWYKVTIVPASRQHADQTVDVDCIATDDDKAREKVQELMGEAWSVSVVILWGTAGEYYAQLQEQVDQKRAQAEEE